MNLLMRLVPHDVFLPREPQSPGDIWCYFANTGRPTAVLADLSHTSIFQERYFYCQHLKTDMPSVKGPNVNMSKN